MDVGSWIIGLRIVYSSITVCRNIYPLINSGLHEQNAGSRECVGIFVVNNEQFRFALSNCDQFAAFFYSFAVL